VPAYLVVEQVVHDTEAMAPYRAGAGPTLARYGGRVVIAGRYLQTLESPDDEPWEPERYLVVEFDDAEAARRWYHSPAYRALTTHRQPPVATTRIILAESL